MVPLLTTIAPCVYPEPPPANRVTTSLPNTSNLYDGLVVPIPRRSFVLSQWKLVLLLNVVVPVKYATLFAAPPLIVPAPDVPELPFAPLAPLVPELPFAPLAPLVPELPFAPLVPDEPLVPELPEVPELPLAPEVPDEPLVPDEPEVPELPF